MATYLDGSDLDPTLSPRPFLHPVQTLGGTVVTACAPEDHRWHLGVSVALQDVGKVNFWGGRTYVRDRGYQWLDDHGIIRHRAWRERTNARFVQDLDWEDPSGRVCLEELRTVVATALPVREDYWALHFSFVLRNATQAPVELGSPATNGREGAGYGGLFWRMPWSRSPIRVFSEEAEGESAVHGSTADWLAFVADADDPQAPYSLVFTSLDGRTREDPWFVRVEGYPGVCSALAFTEPLVLEPAGELRRSLRVYVADGRLDEKRAAALVDEVRDHSPQLEE